MEGAIVAGLLGVIFADYPYVGLLAMPIAWWSWDYHSRRYERVHLKYLLSPADEYPGATNMLRNRTRESDMERATRALRISYSTLFISIALIFVLQALI